MDYNYLEYLVDSRSLTILYLILCTFNNLLSHKNWNSKFTPNNGSIPTTSIDVSGLQYYCEKNVRRGKSISSNPISVRIMITM